MASTKRTAIRDAKVAPVGPDPTAGLSASLDLVHNLAAKALETLQQAHTGVELHQAFVRITFDVTSQHRGYLFGRKFHTANIEYFG
jgi:hypothetical protein